MMTSVPADRLSAALAGRYRIERELGAGGMATVYLAEDLKHDRKVAIKVLKPELAAVLGAERFVVEIKTTAAMSHPHILPLFDSGTADSFLFYVMPYIQGETIREKLNRETQFGVDEAVRIAREVADALDYAHRHGVIHRDIKPENILLHDGRAMVMDFGIALAVSAAAGGRMTETGLSLGTPHYMSPEQATAEKEITARSDQYSLASVLYEMLAGQPPHVGGAAQQVIMKIITERAQPVTSLRKSVPANVDAALAKALEKVPADRFSDAKEFATALGDARYTSESFTGASLSGGSAQWKQRAAVPLVLASLALLAAAAWPWLRSEPPAPVTRYDVAPGSAVPLPSSEIVISPDGSMLAYAGIEGSASPAVYLRRLDGEPDFRKVPGTEGINAAPTFSPDSKWLAFRRLGVGALMKVSVSGTGSKVLANLGVEIGSYLHWGTDDRIIYSGGPQGLFHLPAEGGAPVFLAKTASANRHAFLLPDGSGVLFSRPAGVFLYDFTTDSDTILVPGAVHPAYVESGHVLYIAEGGLFALPFDLSSHRVTGTATRVLDRVAATTGQRGYSVSKKGALVYREGASTFSGGAAIPNRMVIMSFTGASETVELPEASRETPRFSPTGGSITYAAWANRNQDKDIYTVDLTTKTNTRLTFEDNNTEPLWSHDGKRVLFRKPRGKGEGGGLFVKLADNSGAEQRVDGPQQVGRAESWLADGTILYSTRGVAQTFDSWIFPAGAGAAPKPFLTSPVHEQDVTVSPDGKLAAYTAAEAAMNADIWITGYPGGQGKWQVSTTGGAAPRWSKDGKYLYYWKQISLTGDSLFRVRVDRTPAVIVRAPERVLTTTVWVGPRNWDLHPDGTRMVIMQGGLTPASASGTPVSRYLVAVNWFNELRAKVAAAR